MIPEDRGLPVKHVDRRTVGSGSEGKPVIAVGAQERPVDRIRGHRGNRLAGGRPDEIKEDVVGRDARRGDVRDDAAVNVQRAGHVEDEDVVSTTADLEPNEVMLPLTSMMLFPGGPTIVTLLVIPADPGWAGSARPAWLLNSGRVKPEPLAMTSRGNVGENKVPV